MSKSDDAPRQIVVCKEADYRRFMSSVDATKQELDEARMDNANAWKQADELNVHPTVAKLVLKLRKMSEVKRGDYLRAFDMYREWEDFEVEDLVDKAEELARSEAQAKENEALEIEEVDKVQAEHDDRIAARADKAEIEDSFDIDGGADNEIDFGDDEEEEGDPDAYALGEQACRGARKKQENPYDPEETESEYNLWEEGWNHAYNNGEFATAKKDAA